VIYKLISLSSLYFFESQSRTSRENDDVEEISLFAAFDDKCK